MSCLNFFKAVFASGLTVILPVIVLSEALKVINFPDESTLVIIESPVLDVVKAPSPSSIPENLFRQLL